MQSLKGGTRWPGLVVLACLVALAWWLGARHGAENASSPIQPSSVSTTARDLPRDTSTPTSGLGTIPESELPKEARKILVLIHQGGPFRYAQDGQTFGNREGLLPKQQRGYYKEYTVKIGSGDRGPNRIVGGRDGDLYWTADHYGSFRQIVEGT